MSAVQLVFATGNKNKIAEVNALLGGRIPVLGLADIGCTEDLPETHDTLQENALEKAEYVHENYKVDCFAEDSGLEVDALNGAPGVYSARYAGLQKNDSDNITLLLKNMEGEANRKARFRTVISLIINDKKHQFEGVAEGEILHERQGEGGFGYDPVFRPQGYDISFAQMSREEKNSISHRGQAVRQLIEFLKQESGFSAP